MNDAMDRALEMIESRAKQEEQFRIRGGFLVAVLAILLAIAALLGGNASEDMMQYNIQAADAYAFFQAKNIRQTEYKLALDQIEIMLAGNSESLNDAQRQALRDKTQSYAATIQRYESEPDLDEPSNPLKGEGKKELLARARYLEAARDRAAERDTNYDYAGILLQISIVVMSAAIIVVSRPLLIVSLAIAGLGLVFIVNGLFLLTPLPF